MTARMVVCPWNGRAEFGRWSHGMPTFGFRGAPGGLMTRRQLRAAGLRPGRSGVVAQIEWRGGRRWAGLYLVAEATPCPGLTTPQLVSLHKARRALRTCRVCGWLAPRRLPAGRVCADCSTIPLPAA